MEAEHARNRTHWGCENDGSERGHSNSFRHPERAANQGTTAHYYFNEEPNGEAENQTE